MDRKKLKNTLKIYKNEMNKIDDTGVGKYVKIESALCISNILETIIRNQNNNPYLPLINRPNSQIGFLKEIQRIKPLLGKNYVKKCVH